MSINPNSIQSIRQFAFACERLTSNEIFELFEALQHELREEIYNTFWSLSKEPARAALRQLGERYCIQSLYEY